MTSLPSLADALIVIIFLMPGFITFFLMRRLAALGRELQEFETIIWSIIFTVVLLIPYTAITGLNDIDKIRDGIFNPINLGILIGLAIGVGLLAGYIYQRFRKNYHLGDPWEIIMEGYAKGGSWVIVITKDEKEYKGMYKFAGISDDRREIVLINPMQIFRDQNSNVTQEMEFGKTIVFTEGDIARVTFLSEWSNKK